MIELFSFVLATCFLWLARGGASNGIWSFIGDCDFDQTDPECVTNKGFRSGYDAQDACIMRILGRPRKLDVKTLVTRAHYDFLGMYGYSETSGEYNAGTVSTISFNGALITQNDSLTFRSTFPAGYSNGFTGYFRVCARVLGTWYVKGPCSIDTDTDCITSRDYPSWYTDGYQSNEECTMQLVGEPREIEVTDFKVKAGDIMSATNLFEPGDEHHSGYFHGISSLNVVHFHGVTVTNKTVFRWTTPDSSRYRVVRGWRMCARTPRIPGPVLHDRFWTLYGSCTVDASDPDCVTSLNHPHHYRNYDWCHIATSDNQTRILEVPFFYTADATDTLSVQPDGERHHGTNPGDLVGATLDKDHHLAWSTYKYSTASGWKVCARLPPTTTILTTTTRTTTTRTSTTTSTFTRTTTTRSLTSTTRTSTTQTTLTRSTTTRTTTTTTRSTATKTTTTETTYTGTTTTKSASITTRTTKTRTTSSPTTVVSTTTLAPPRPSASITLKTTSTTTTTVRIWYIEGDCEIDPVDSECITSDRYPLNYSNNARCIMHLGIPRYMVMTDFKTESHFDNFTVVGMLGPSALNTSGTGPAWVHGLTLDSSVAMAWSSDQDTTAKGWRLCARPPRNEPMIRDFGSWHAFGSCEFDTSDPACITSYNFPGQYRNYDWCFFHVLNKSARLRVTHFEMASANDGIEVNGTAIHGTDSGPLQHMLVTDDAWLFFGSTTSFGAGGWRICADPVIRHPDPDGVDSDTLTVSSASGSRSVGIVAGVGAAVLMCTACLLCCWKGNKCCHWIINEKIGRSVMITSDVPTTTVVSAGSRPIQCSLCRHEFSVPVESSIELRHVCPACLAPNEFSILPHLAGTVPDQAPLPSYWASDRALGLFEGLVQESPAMKRAMQTLLDQTWTAKVTRDRSTSLTKFEVLMVHRNENASKWDRYARTRASVAEQCRGCRKQVAKTEAQVAGCPHALDLFKRAELDSDSNEFYLFHGTSPAAARAICDNSFMLSMSGTRTGSLFGPGLYFAEASSKADEYASEDVEGIFTGQYAMLVCRVVCGDMIYSAEVEPKVDELLEPIVRTRTKHSVLGDREKCRGTYREFVVFDRDQVYPEFVVIYRRVPVEEESTG